MQPRPSTAAPALLAAAAAAALSACVVVPLDPRTGQPYPGHGYPGSHSHAPQTVTVVQPPNTPPAPPPTVVLTARLYPLNAQANKAGLLTAVVVDHQGGRGTFSISYLGDSLQGEATRVDSGYAAFGRVHTEVLGATNRAFSGQRGIANGFGGKGVNAQCEYLITGPGIGTGACLFSDGAKYQMHFGS
jgi:hypothetical protein